jgi:hypothetical protein
MKELLEKLVTYYNKTHKGQLFIKDNIIFHADISGLAFPLDYFKTDDVKTAFDRLTKLIFLYQTIDKRKWKNIFIYRDNVTVYTGWNEIKLYPLDNNTVQVKHYYKYSLKQTITRSFDSPDKLIKIAILP